MTIKIIPKKSSCFFLLLLVGQFLLIHWLFPNTVGASDIIALRADANGNYVCADNAGANPLIAKSTSVGPWEQFERTDLGNNQISLKSLANNMYVCADNAGANPLIANRTSVGPWETFTVVDMGNGKIALKAQANGNYVCADNAGANPLIANRTAAGLWETFAVTIQATATPTPAGPTPTPDPGIPAALPTTEVRSQVCLNGVWNFLPDGGSQTTIQVPATWDKSTDSNHNCYRAFDYPSSWTGGTYSRTFSVPSAMNGKVIKAAFESVRYNSTVKVNNTQVGTNNDGFLPFEFKVNGQLNGSSNQLSVYVDPNNSTPIGLSGTYERNRGIWQDVWLKAYPLVYVDNAFFVKTSFRYNQIACDIPVKNEDSVSRTFYLRNFVTDAAGNIVLTFDAGWKTLAANSGATYSVTCGWNNPRLWWPQDPYLYNIHTVIYDQNKTTVVDWKKTRFGFKEFYVQNGTEFWLNGRRAFLRGDGHHYQGEYQQTRDYYVALFTALKEFGCNYFRTHTIIYDPVMYDVADEMGMMLVDESAIYGSDGDSDCTGYYPNHLQRWIERNRNHPSIMLWSFSNEVNWKCQELGVGNHLVDHSIVCQTADPTRVSYAEGDNYSGNVVCSQHYFDFNHCGPGTGEAVPINDGGKVHIMGEYCNYMIACFGQTGTGACGYETTSQDYGTGYWTHGEMARDQTKAIQNERRYGGYLSWSLYWFANRSLPFFNSSVHYLNWSDLTAPGAKPQKVNPYMHTINWVDPDLPLYDPLPWFYLYSCYYKDVRCSDLMSDSTQKNCNFYAGSTFNRNFNLSYESFADANHLKLEIVKKADGSVLYSNDLTGAPWNNLQAGMLLSNQNVSWVAPNVSVQTPVTINRSFYNGSQLSYKCSFDGNIFPRFTTANLPGLSGKNIALLDTNGNTKAVLDSMGVSYTQVSALSGVSYPAYHLLIIGDLNSTSGLSANFVINGGRVLCLQQSAKPSLPINLPSLVSGTQKDVQFLLNGVKHAIFNGLNQNDLSYWYNNVNTANNVYNRPSVSENIRVLLAANNDGANAPILEVPAGSGTYLLSQMELINQYNNEPVAGKLLVNMLNYLGGYTPATKAKTGLIAASGAIKTYYDGLGLRYTSLDAANLPDLSPYTLLIVDGTSTSIVSNLNANKARLDSFVNGGGKIMICQINSGTISTYQQLISGYPLTLTTPAEKQRSIKCAVSWRHKNTTNDPVRYGYLNIPPPFEPNPDELLLGLNNKDFDWTVNQLNNAVKAGGSYPNVNALIAPCRIDWTYLTSDRGEFSSPPKRAQYRNDWFLNREPVLLKLRQGNGFWLINELLLENDSTNGKRIGNLLLTNLGASVGGTDTYYNLNYSLIPSGPTPTPGPTAPPTTATPSPTPMTNAFQQDSGADGIVSMEAEHYDGNIVYTYPAQGGTMWSSVTSPTGYSGSGAMQAVNNIGNVYDTNYVGNSPLLEFNINFVKTGTHYLWILGNAQGSVNDDTCHAGLDGAAVSSAARISLNAGASWKWTNLTESSAVVTINITSAGIHKLDLWDKEDGIIVDKVVLTTNAGYTPTGFGPVESSRGGSATPTPTPTATLTPTPTPTPTNTATPTPIPGMTPLDRTGWVGSGTGNNFSNAFDGNAATRWSTDALQVNGQYFQVDMQSARTFNMIRLDTTGSPNDYPRGYQVFVSSDGTNWGSAIATGAGSSAITDITFSSQMKRYVKIIQTGSAPGNYWSIHEYNAYTNSSTPTPTPTPVPGGATLDNCDALTGWSSHNTLSLDTTNKQQGTGCLSETGSLEGQFFKTFSTPVNSGVTESAGYLEFEYYISDATKLGANSQIEISSSGTCDVNEYSWPVPSGLVNGWNHIKVKLSNAGKIGTPNLSAINWFRIYDFVTASVTAKIDYIRFTP